MNRSIAERNAIAALGTVAAVTLMVAGAILALDDAARRNLPGCLFSGGIYTALGAIAVVAGGLAAALSLGVVVRFWGRFGVQD